MRAIISAIIHPSQPRLSRLPLLGLLLSLNSFGVAALGQSQPATQEKTGPQVIRVWRVGSPHRGDVPYGLVPEGLKEKAAKLNCQLVIRDMPARDLSGSFSNAVATNDEPDILVIDNMGLIVGITTQLGRFDGIGRDAKVQASLLNVSESLRSLETHPGWEYLIKTSQNYLKAKSLVMMEPECSPANGGKDRPWPGDTFSEISKTAETAASAYFNRDLATLNVLVGGTYLDDSTPFREANSVILGVKMCGGWGNQQLAFINTVTSFESVDHLGSLSLLAVMTKAEGTWKLILLGEDPRIVKTLQQRAPALTISGDAASELQAPMLMAPADGAFFSRWPLEERPELVWTKTGNGPVIYLVESQFKSGGRWWGRGFVLVPSFNKDALTIKIRATFGVGRQPHRWRIWAITEGGDAARSEWRVVNYLN